MITKKLIVASMLVAGLLALVGCGASPATGETPANEVGPEQVVVAGEMPVPQTGSQDVAEMIVEQTSPDESSSGLEIETPCQSGASGLEVFTGEGYCLLYPPGYTVTNPEDGVVVIHGLDYGGGGPEPLGGYVNISVAPNNEGLTAPQISDQVVAEAQPLDPSAMIERVDAALGGEQAVEIIGVPGQRLSWHVVAVHNGQVYTLVFGPLGEDYGEAFVDMQTLYDVVMPTFVFLP